MKETDRLGGLIIAIREQLFSLDRNWRFVCVNAGLTEVTGQPPGELRGQSIWEVLPELVGTDIERALRDAASTRTPVHIEVGDPASRRWFDLHAYPTASSTADSAGDELTVFVHEVSERKRLDEALGESERQLRLITNALPAIISYVDTEHRYRFINDTFREWFGLPPEEVIGRHIRDVLGEAAYQTILPAMETALSGQAITFERLIPYKNIEPRYVRANYVPDIDSTGHVHGYFALILDTTEHKRTEGKLRESEERFLKAFNASPLSLTISSLKTGKLIEVNDTFVRLSGYTREEAIGRTTAELKLWSNPPEREQELDIVRQIGRLRNAEYRFRTRDGHELVGLLSAERIDIGGEPFALTVIQDITESKQAEEALRESEERFLKAFNASPHLMTMTTLEDGEYLAVNDAVLQATGYRRDEMIGHSADELGIFAEPEGRAKLLAAFRDNVVRDLEIHLRMKNGDVRLLKLSADIITVGGHRCLLTSSQDITEQKRADKERAQLLERAQAARVEAETANRLKDEFLATVSHELRTPLNAILGWTMIARDSGNDAERVNQALAIIERNARNQNQLITDILDVSRIITGKLTIEARPVNLAYVIEAAADTVRPALQAKSIRFDTRLHTGAGLVRGDANRLQQVVWNLLANAVKFTPEGGQIGVVLEPAGTHLEIRVTDSGDGITAEFLPFVFDRFRQADGRVSRQHGGLGLGLSIVRHLVELHGGTVRVDSEGAGKGTTFTVALPIMSVTNEPGTLRPPPQALRPAAGDAPNQALAGLRVLVVDDELDACQLVEYLLKQHGAEVISALSVSEALEKLEQESFDVLISDIGMPGQDGFELIREIRRRQPAVGSPLPAIALTAYARSEDRRRVLAAGFQEHTPKPIDAAELVKTIAALHNQTRHHSKT